MAIGKDKTATAINANIPDEIMIEFEVARVRRKMKKQEALAAALKEWAEKSGGINQREVVTRHTPGYAPSTVTLNAVARVAEITQSLESAVTELRAALQEDSVHATGSSPATDQVEELLPELVDAAQRALDATDVVEEDKPETGDHGKQGRRKVS